MRDTFEERVARVIRRMVPGGFAGRTEQVAPVRTVTSPVQTYRPAAGSGPWIAGAGAGSALLPGADNIATGAESVAHGTVCAAEGDYSHAEGNACVAEAIGSHAEGDGTDAHGIYSHAEGKGDAIGAYSHAEGAGGADGDYSHAEGGTCTAWANGMSSTGGGLGQANRVVLQGETTDATPTALVDCINQALVLPSSRRTIHFVIYAVARIGTPNGVDSCWKIEGVVRSDAAGTYTFIGATPVATVVAQDAGAVTWAVVLSITGGNTLVITATGAAATEIDWMATIYMDEVG